MIAVLKFAPGPRDDGSIILQLEAFSGRAGRGGAGIMLCAPERFRAGHRSCKHAWGYPAQNAPGRKRSCKHAWGYPAQNAPITACWSSTGQDGQRKLH